MCLSQRVVSARHKTNTSIGERSTITGPASDDPLYVAVRSHANFLETAPIGLILALCAELNGANRRTVGYALAALLGLRVVNVFVASSTQIRHLLIRISEGGMASKGCQGKGRLIGYWGTGLWILAMSAYNVLLTRDFWGF